MGVIRGMFLSMTIATGYPSDGSNIEICYWQTQAVLRVWKMQESCLWLSLALGVPGEVLALL
jgi:hypothetical protein